MYLNRGHLVSETTALPTEPQPLPNLELLDGAKGIVLESQLANYNEKFKKNPVES